MGGYKAPCGLCLNTSSAFTRSNFYTKRFYTQMRFQKRHLHTEVFTQMGFYTNDFTHRSMYTQTLLHPEAFTQTKLFTQRSLSTKRLLYAPSVHVKRLPLTLENRSFTSIFDIRPSYWAKGVASGVGRGQFSLVQRFLTFGHHSDAPFLRTERKEKKGDKHRDPSRNQEEPANHDGTEPLS